MMQRDVPNRLNSLNLTSGNASAYYSRRARLEFRIEHRLRWLEDFVGLLSPLKQTLA
jgi:predicted DNA-binding protein